MTEFKNRVERQRVLLEAEEWAKGVKSIHAHRLQSMWYDNRPLDTLEGGVCDTIYNDDSIKRELENGKVVWMNTEKKTGDDLIDQYIRIANPSKSQRILL